MKQKVVLGTIIATVLYMSTTVFASDTLGREIGDVSMGNHPMAPYAESKIIVPRPEKSQYSSLPLISNTFTFTDISGHWAEKEIAYFLNKGFIDNKNGKFQPNELATYVDFAEIVARMGLKPAKFNGGTVSYKTFINIEAWSSNYSENLPVLICSEVGVWGNPSEVEYSNEPFAGKIKTHDKVQRQYIALYLANMIDASKSENAGYSFSDANAFDKSKRINESVNTLVDEGIMTRYSDGSFKPQLGVTKAEMVVMLYRTLAKYNFDTNAISNNLYGNFNSFYWEQSLELLELVNQERISTGIKPLEYDADLNALCEIKMLEKSIYGYDTFNNTITYNGKQIADGHVSKFWGRATEMAQQFGLKHYLVGENAIKGAPEAKTAHDRISSSKDHKNNYLKDEYKIAGFVVGEKATYEMFAYFK